MPETPINAQPIRDFDGSTPTAAPVHDQQLAELYEAGQRRALAWQLFFMLASGIGVFAYAYAQRRR